MKTKKSWQEKMKKPAEVQIKEAPEKWRERYGETMLIPTPMEIKAVVEKIPEGKLSTVGEIRKYLAKKFDVDFACPLTTGIFLRIVAEAVEENRENGIADNTPYWRVIKDDGSLNQKFTKQQEYLENEGFTVVKKGKTKLKVENFKDYLLHYSEFS